MREQKRRESLGIRGYGSPRKMRKCVVNENEQS